MAGFVYIMSNPLFDRIKIGKSTKDPTKDRLDELNRETGTPEKYKCEYYAFVGDEHGLERAVHREVFNKRPNPKREFFEVSVPEAISEIRRLATNYEGIKLEEIYYKSPEEIAEIEEAKRTEAAARKKRLAEAEQKRKNEEERLRQEADGFVQGRFKFSLFLIKVIFVFWLLSIVLIYNWTKQSSLIDSHTAFIDEYASALIALWILIFLAFASLCLRIFDETRPKNAHLDASKDTAGFILNFINKSYKLFSIRKSYSEDRSRRSNKAHIYRSLTQRYSVDLILSTIVSLILLYIVWHWI
jgi:hypothetical protein